MKTVWPVMLVLLFSIAAVSYAELPAPAISTYEIETQFAPTWVAFLSDGETRYLVVVEPYLIEVFSHSTGNALDVVGRYPSSSTLGKCVIGYFNGDDYWDLAVTESLCGHVRILLGSGEGLDYYASFESQSTHLDRVVAGDFDGDGADDLLLTNFCGGKVIVMMNDGYGNFAYHAEYADGAGHQEAALDDFNGDGNLDYIVTTQTYNESIQRFGDGTGNFLLPQVYSIGSDGYTSSLVDLDDDGIRDYVCGTGRDIRVFKGRPSGVFQRSSESFGFGYGPIQYRSVAGDFNGDGHRDVCSFIAGLYDEIMGEIQFWYGDGTGDLTPTERISVDGVSLSREVWPLAMRLDSDEKTDLLITGNDPDHPAVKLYIMQ
jgi:hypothetical protein